MKSKRYRAIKKAKWEEDVSDNAKYWTWRWSNTPELPTVSFEEFKKTWKGAFNHD